MTRKSFVFFGTLLLTLSLPAAFAHADSIQLTISNPAQSVAATDGGTVEFSGTVSAPASNTADVYLNGDNYLFPVTGSTVDDSPFLDGSPFFLVPGQSYTGELFAVTLPANVAQGEYDGTFSILAGPDSNTYSILSTADFSVTATPEPPTFLLVGSSMFGLAFALRKCIYAVR